MNQTPQPKTIVIKGTSSGFGALSAKSLAARGHDVVATMRDASTRNQAKRDELESFANAHLRPARVRVPSYCRGVSDSVLVAVRAD